MCRKNFCYFESWLEEGIYTLVATTFQQGEKGHFVLNIGSVALFTIEQIKPEGEGMISTQIEDVWDQETAGGNPSTRTYLKNPKFNLKLSQNTNIKYV